MAGARPQSPLVLTIDQKQITSLVRALKEEEDGKALKKQLFKDLRAAAAPGVPKLQSAVRAIPAHSLGSPQLRDCVAREISVAIRGTGPMAGVRFKVGTNKDPVRPGKGGGPGKKFKLAGRRLNNGWRHPLFGHSPWIQQRPRPWFEPALERDIATYREAVVKVMNDMADRIARRAK